jgi:hypothetical protein
MERSEGLRLEKALFGVRRAVSISRRLSMIGWHPRQTEVGRWQLVLQDIQQPTISSFFSRSFVGQAL